jgi:hypothetical protein
MPLIENETAPAEDHIARPGVVAVVVGVVGTDDEIREPIAVHIPPHCSPRSPLLTLGEMSSGRSAAQIRYFAPTSSGQRL